MAGMQYLTVQSDQLEASYLKKFSHLGKRKHLKVMLTEWMKGVNELTRGALCPPITKAAYSEAYYSTFRKLLVTTFH